MDQTMKDLESCLLDSTTIRAPFHWGGSKGRALKRILPYLPTRYTWIDHFGGSGVVSWNVEPCPVMVYNDKDTNLCHFFRSLKTRPKELIDYLTLMPTHSREEYFYSFTHDPDPIIRAARWYYGTCLSVLGKRDGFARGVNSRTSNLASFLPALEGVRKRLVNFQISNADVSESIKLYDSPDTVHYFDPPYVGMKQNGYSHHWSQVDQSRLLESIAHCLGFCALSGYYCPETDQQSFWTERIQWSQLRSATTLDKTQGPDYAREFLWLKK
jgi:DNA adenine methylase